MQILVVGRFPKLETTKADSEGTKENWGTKQARWRGIVIVFFPGGDSRARNSQGHQYKTV